MSNISKDNRKLFPEALWMDAWFLISETTHFEMMKRAKVLKNYQLKYLNSIRKTTTQFLKDSTKEEIQVRLSGMLYGPLCGIYRRVKADKNYHPKAQARDLAKLITPNRKLIEVSCSKKVDDEMLSEKIISLICTKDDIEGALGPSRLAEKRLNIFFNVVEQRTIKQFKKSREHWDKKIEPKMLSPLLNVFFDEKSVAQAVSKLKRKV